MQPDVGFKVARPCLACTGCVHTHNAAHMTTATAGACRTASAKTRQFVPSVSPLPEHAEIMLPPLMMPASRTTPPTTYCNTIMESGLYTYLLPTGLTVAVDMTLETRQRQGNANNTKTSPVNRRLTWAHVVTSTAQTKGWGKGDKGSRACCKSSLRSSSPRQGTLATFEGSSSAHSAHDTSDCESQRQPLR